MIHSTFHSTCDAVWNVIWQRTWVSHDGISTQFNGGRSREGGMGWGIGVDLAGILGDTQQAPKVGRCRVRWVL